jgi:hypothetical protein
MRINESRQKHEELGGGPETAAAAVIVDWVGSTVVAAALGLVGARDGVVPVFIYLNHASLDALV